MKLSQLKPVALDLPIVLPNGVDTGIVFKVICMDTPGFRQKEKEVIKWAAMNKDAIEEEKDRKGAEMLAECVIDWTGLQNEDGSPMLFDRATCADILSNAEYSYIAATVGTFVSARAQFFRESTEPVAASGKAPSKARSKRQ